MNDERHSSRPVDRLIAGRTSTANSRRPVGLRLVGSDLQPDVIDDANSNTRRNLVPRSKMMRSPVTGYPSMSRTRAAMRETPPVTDERDQGMQATDPRWVLAIRVSEQLEGTILRPDKRERLVKLGKLLGLTAFDANLIIAIVQDQARRGYEPSYCPTAGEAQLAMVPMPNAARRAAGQVRHKTMCIASIIAAAITAEVFLLWWFFR
jgi:hypothetical protein